MGDGNKEHTVVFQTVWNWSHQVMLSPLQVIIQIILQCIVAAAHLFTLHAWIWSAVLIEKHRKDTLEEMFSCKGQSWIDVE